MLERFRGIELRYYMVAAHYRSTVEFSFEALGEAAVAFRRIEAFLARATEALGELPAPGIACADFEQAMDEAKAIKPNLDYPAGPTYHLMGFDTELFTPLFIAARITGWTAHIMEQRANNSLIRPLSAYNGPDERHVPGA